MIEPYNFEALPARAVESLTRWIERGQLPSSGFLGAVLRNDLCDACARADSTNAGLLRVYMAWLSKVAPSVCWGSPAKVDAWVRFHAGTPDQAERDALGYNRPVHGLRGRS